MIHLMIEISLINALFLFHAMPIRIYNTRKNPLALTQKILPYERDMKNERINW